MRKINIYALFPNIMNSVFIVCPRCKTKMVKSPKSGWTIIKRGHERNGTARFFCKNCGKFFNAKTGLTMEWAER